MMNLDDHIFETSSTVGSGDYALAGAVSGFKGFATQGNNAYVPYAVTQMSGNTILAWETGIGKVVTGSPDTLQRFRVHKSSNANAAVNWGAGVKNVRLGMIADVMPARDENLNFLEGLGTVGGTANALTLTLYPAPKAYSKGMKIRGYTGGSPNNGATNINVNALGAKSMLLNNSAMVGGELPANTYFEAEYNGTAFDLLYPIFTKFASASQGAAADALFAAMKNRVLNGLMLSNNTADATNTANAIDIAPGAAISDDGTTMMVVSSTITKRVNAAWASGGIPTAASGGLDTGAVADVGYYVWLIHRPDTGVTDVLFSTSATAPTMPTNYTKKKRIGSIIRLSGSIRTFKQMGAKFYMLAPINDYNGGTISITDVNVSLPVPAGDYFDVEINIESSRNSSTVIVYANNGGQVAYNIPELMRATGVGSVTNFQTSWAQLVTNTSGQITMAASANNTVNVCLRAYIDRGI